RPDLAMAPAQCSARPGASRLLARDAALDGHAPAYRPGRALAGVSFPRAVPGRRADLRRLVAARPRGRGAGADRTALPDLAGPGDVGATGNRISPLGRRQIITVDAPDSAET